MFNIEKQAAYDLVRIAWPDFDSAVVDLMKAMILLAGENNGQVVLSDTDAGLQVVGLSRNGVAWDTTDGRTQATLQDAIGILNKGKMPIMAFSNRVGKLARFGYLVLDVLQGK
jgi:hypothetical protein